MNNLISVIIPIYNAEKYLSETLESVINQTYKNWELIVVNDGSTDNSLTILKKFAQTQDKIKIYNIKNSGQCAASNYGIKHSTGDYIKFLDADDIISKNHLELQLNVLKNTNNCIASCEWGRFYDDNYKSAQFKPESVWQDMDSFDWLKVALSQKTDMMGAWLWLIPKVVLNKAGFWNEKLTLNNDFDFSIRLLLASKRVKFAKGAKLYYRSGLQNSLSQEFSINAINSALLTTELACKNILLKENSFITRSLCANRYQMWVYRIYPKYPQMISLFENKIKELGGSNIKIDGGKIFIFLKSILGWKLTKRIQLLSYKYGWKLIIRFKKILNCIN